MTSDPSEAQELLALSQLGNRDAFNKLFSLHTDYLRRVIVLRMDRQLRSRLDPSDVLQEAQMEAFQRLPDYCERRPMTFRLWLRKTACERLLMLRRHHLKAAKRARGRESLLSDNSSILLAERLQSAGSTPSQHVMKEEQARKIRVIIEELPNIDREILVMRNLESLSNKEVAEVLQIDPSTASQRYGRALLHLRKVLIARGLKGSHS